MSKYHILDKNSISFKGESISKVWECVRKLQISLGYRDVYIPYLFWIQI
jgi:hypothetical protein